jgi:hypothetical protein
VAVESIGDITTAAGVSLEKGLFEELIESLKEAVEISRGQNEQ